jgi:hypothetical protein
MGRDKEGSEMFQRRFRKVPKKDGKGAEER